MASSTYEDSTPGNLPPGTFRLISEDEPTEGESGERLVLLMPRPSKDPNEPLNWSTSRKALNFGLVLAVSCLIFTALSIQSIFWQMMVVDLDVTYGQLNRAMAVNNAGLAAGCFFFIPLAQKFGRRPIYLVSTALMLATSFWSGEVHSLAELYIANLLQGLAGATNEAITQITIADMFFVHHRGSMNGLYMTTVMIGGFLSPIAAGTQATRQGWRWSYRTMGIVNAVVLALFIFFYEETKYVPPTPPPESSTTPPPPPPPLPHSPDAAHDDGSDDAKAQVAEHIENPSAQHHRLDPTIPLKSYNQRLPMLTYTPESIWPYFTRPVVTLLSFPDVFFSALQYASGVFWLTVMSNVLSLVLPQPPYNFTPEQIGFMSLGPFIGNVIGAGYGGFLGDKSILFFSRRNRGYYEPEMRLYILHLPALALSGGLIMFGATLDRGMHYIYPSIGGALFGFGLGSISDAALTLVIDSHRGVTGDAFTGIACIRNAFSIGAPFAVIPWMQSSGLTNMFIACGLISLAISLLYVPMVYLGKMFRRRTAARYYAMAATAQR